MNASGLVTGSAVTKCKSGTGTVTATNNAHVSDTSTITVNNTETVSSVTIAPAAGTMAELATVQLNATMTLSDASTALCNTGCCGTTTTWASAGMLRSIRAAWSPAARSPKCAGGTGTVTATNNAHVSNTSTITVNNDETVFTMTIAPASATITEAARCSLNATASLSNGEHQRLQYRLLRHDHDLGCGRQRHG